MTELPQTIQILPGILEHVGDAYVAGHSYVDEQGRWMLQLGLGDRDGEREVHVVEGDTVDFVGATWKVDTVYEPSADSTELGILARV